MTEQKRKRGKNRTPEEIIADLEKKIEIQKAKAAGTYDPEKDSYGVKRIRAALRRRKTALHAAEVTINGRAATAKSPALNGIDDKIDNARSRLDNLTETRNRAMLSIANLPDDIRVLEDLVQRAEKGEEVEFPTGLHHIPGDQTEAEAETASVLDEN